MSYGSAGQREEKGLDRRNVPRTLEYHTSVNYFMWEKGENLRMVSRTGTIDPFTLIAAKRGLMILEIFYVKKHFEENIRKRYVDQKANNNSPSNFS